MKNKIILAIFIILLYMNGCKNDVTGGDVGGGVIMEATMEEIIMEILE